jgi:hydroxyacylglutathione hydrolase
VIIHLLSDSMESNAYLVVSDRVCVIDPGINPQRVLNHVSDYHIGIHVLINTHYHYDHVGANPGILKTGGIESCCHALDAPAIEDGVDGFQLASFLGGKAVKHRVERKLKGCDTIDLGKIKLEVLHTPGHTRGSICLFEPESKTLFSGDTIFADGIGRTDFMGGNDAEMARSLRKIREFALSRKVEVLCPGHGAIGDGADVLDVCESFR